MAAKRQKKAKFVEKKKKTLIPEPNWDKLRKAKTEEERIEAFVKCEDFAHMEADPKLALHWLKKWIREESGWDMHEETVILPDVFMTVFAKHGWKAMQLKFMPESVKKSLENTLLPLLKRAHTMRENVDKEKEIYTKVVYDFVDPKEVKEWLTEWSKYLSSSKSNAESKDPKVRIQYQTAETYVQNMRNYLRTGMWNDSHFGENREKKVLAVCKAMAYDRNGEVKRTVGVWYPDIQSIWKREYVK